MTSIQVGDVAAMAFMNRVDLSSAEISGDVGPFAFYGCTNLKRVRFGTASRKISEYAFYGCTSLEDVEVPRAITQIGDCAFADCAGVVTFVNPMGVNTDPGRKIANSAFVGSGGLSIRINTGSGISFLSSDYLGNGSGFVFDRTAGAVAQQADTFLSVDPSTNICSGFRTSAYPRPAIVAFPVGVVALAPLAFQGQTSVTDVVLPSTLVRTGEFAFYGCTQLRSIFCAEGLPVAISAYSFYGCTSLTETRLQNETVEVGDCAFGNSGLTTIQTGYSWGFTFPLAQSAFYSLNASAFFSDPSLTRTSVASITDGTSARVATVPWLAAGAFLAIDPSSQVCSGFQTGGGGGGAYPRPEILVIPSGVREISAGAFAGNTTVKTVFIPASVVSVGAGAFADCSGLTTVFYRSQTAFDGIAFGAGPYTGTAYIADMLGRTPAVDVVITAPAYDTVSVVWTPTAYTFYPRVSYTVSVSGDLVATLVKPSPLSTVLTLADPKLYVVEVQAVLFGSDAWGTPQTLVVDNRTVGQKPNWWPNYTMNQSYLESVLAERYAPQLLSVSDAHPLTYYLSDGGTISGGLTDYAVEWSRRATNAGRVSLLFIYRVMTESTDATTVRRGEQGLIQLIPQIIQMPPVAPVISATVFADSVYCKWTRPAYFWDCYATYLIYVDAVRVTDTNGTQSLLNGLSLGAHTIGVAAINLLGMEGAVATTTVTIDETVAEDAIAPAVHTLLKDGTTRVRLNDAISLADDPVVRGYVRMLGGPCIEATTAVPGRVYLSLTGDSQLTATWTAPPQTTGLSAPLSYLLTATNQTDPAMSGMFDTGTADRTTYVLNGLVGWDFYVVSAQAIYEEGISASSVASSPIQVVSVPPPPTGLTIALTSGGAISMNWDWYYISFFARILSHTVEFVDVNDPSGSPTVITDIVSRPLVLPNRDSVYKFRVRAVNQFGTGPWSAYSRRLGVYATPDAPVLTGALEQGNSPNMSFAWTTDNPGPDITEYVMTMNGREVHLAPTVTSSEVTGLPYGTAVTVTVRAVNANGSSALSNEVSLVATATPDVPTWVDVQECDLQLTLSWLPPDVTGGSPILDYTVFVYNQDTDELFEYTTTDTTFVPPVLVDGATYNIAVSARNAKGEGDRIAWPDSVVAFLAMPPDVPMDVGIGGWEEPMTDGGAPLEGYVVCLYTVSGSEPIVFNVGAAERSVELAGIPVEEIYCMTVAARNRRGNGPVAVALFAGIQPVVAVPSGHRAIRVTWPAMSANGFPGVLSYTVRAVLDLGEIMDEQIVESEVSSVEFTDQLIYKSSPGTGQNDLYNFQISVNYLEGFIGVPFFGETVCAPVAEPSVVQNLTVIQTYDDRILIQWTPPEQDGGSPIVRYTYTIIGPYSQLTSFADGNALAATNKPRDAGAYTIRVVAANAYAEGESVEFSSFAYTTLPGAPRQLVVDAVDSTAAIARWLAPLSAGGLPVLSYDLEYYTDAAPDVVVRASTGSALTYKMLTEMDSSLVYTIRARTVTTKGVSDWTEYVAFSFSEDLPPRVDVSVVKSGGDLLVTWTELPDARYVIAVNEASSPEVYTMVTQEYLMEPSIVYTPSDTGLYTFRVMAINVVGVGQWSYSEPFAFTKYSGEEPGAVCFLGNAPVLTPTGYRRIDSLCVGDHVRTADGRAVVVQRVLHQRVRPGRNTCPYRIPRGKFGATRGVWISPEHRVCVPGQGMVEARHLGLVQMDDGAAGSWLEYYNLELPDWKRDNLVVAGVEVESMAPFRRVRVTHAEFLRLLRESYGGTITRELVDQLRQKCVFFTDGTVEVPIVRPAIGTNLSS